MKTRNHIVCFHLLNDLSGSPLVLSNVIKGFISKGLEVDLFVSKNQKNGFLSNLEGVNYIHFPYKYGSNKFFTFIKLFLSQLILIIKLFRYIFKPVVFYVNTAMPFGALIAGFIMRKKIVCHLHETSIRPKIFKKFLFSLIGKSADELIYVSHFLQQSEPFEKGKNHVVYNALSDQFVQQSLKVFPKFNERFNVLMICSLKAYKGVFDFVELANQTPKIDFCLVLNSSKAEIDEAFSDTNLPENIEIFPAQNNVHAFYQKANLVLNLSHPDKWVETFGMTALEAMSYGLPVIVPPVGGIAELVEDGYNGFKVEVFNLELIRRIIKGLSRSRGLYRSLSRNAKNKSKQFQMNHMNQQIQKIVFS